MAPADAGLPIMSAVSHISEGSRMNPSASATFTSWNRSVAARTSASVGSPGPGESAMAGSPAEAKAIVAASAAIRSAVFIGVPPDVSGLLNQRPARLNRYRLLWPLYVHAIGSDRTSWNRSVAARTSASVGSPGPGESAMAGSPAEAKAIVAASAAIRSAVFIGVPPDVSGLLNQRPARLNRYRLLWPLYVHAIG